MNLFEVRERATITIPEAGELLGLGRSAAYDAARRGEIPVLTLGRRHMVPVPALMRLLGADPVSNGEHSGARALVETTPPGDVTGRRPPRVTPRRGRG